MHRPFLLLSVAGLRAGVYLVATGLVSTAVAGAEAIEAFTEPYRTAVIVPSQAGTLESLRVTVGQRVSDGQDLGSLDCEVLRVQRKISQTKSEASGELEAAKAELKVRQSLYERYLALRQGSNEASELEVDRKRADMEIQQAKVRSVEDSLALLRLEVELLDAQIRQRTFLSPIEGVVASVDAEEGDFVAPGQTKMVVTIVNIGRLRATFHVPSREAMALTTDREVSLEVTEMASRVTGQIEFISPVTDPRTGTVQVRVVIPNELHPIRSGLRCRYRSHEGRQTTPAEAKSSTSPPK